MNKFISFGREGVVSKKEVKHIGNTIDIIENLKNTIEAIELADKHTKKLCSYLANSVLDKEMKDYYLRIGNTIYRLRKMVQSLQFEFYPGDNTTDNLYRLRVTFSEKWFEGARVLYLNYIRAKDRNAAKVQVKERLDDFPQVKWLAKIELLEMDIKTLR